MPRLPFILLICLLGVSAIAQTLAYSHLSHARDKAMAAPMLESKDSPVFVSTEFVADAQPVTTPAPTAAPQAPVYPVVPAHDTWSPAMVILVASSIITSIGGLITLIVTTLTKSKLEIMRESSHQRDIYMTEVKAEVVKNTAITERAAKKVDEVDKKLPIKQSEIGEPE